jgi:DNA-binding PadR family transcriptional regulator
MSSEKLTPFSYVVLTLVGEGGAGPHDIVRMMRRGRVYWTAPESQFYAEPKRLAQLGLLQAQTTPGRTRARTHYTLTDAGRAALREWLATPARFARIQNEGVARVLASEYADRGEVLAGLGALRAEIAELEAGLDEAREIEPELPHRQRALRINQRLARRILEAHLEWLDEVEREL